MKEYYNSDTCTYFNLTIVKYPTNIAEDDFDEEIVSTMKSLGIDTDPENSDDGTVFAIEETCENLVRLVDITSFAKDLARKYPDSVFRLKGTIDNTWAESPCLDFEIEYDGKHKLTVRTSDWYFVIDSDDAVSKEYLSSMYDCMQKTGADVVMCGYREVQGDHSRDLVLSGEAMESLKGTLREDLVILRYYISSPCMKIFRKDRVEALHLRFREDMALAEDRFFNNHYFAQCRTVGFVNRAHYIYYRSDTGLSRAATASCFENEMENLAYMIRFMEGAQIERREAIIAEYMCQCIRRYIRMPEEKNTMGAVCRRMKRIRLYDQPAKLWARRDQVLYDLLRRRIYAMIPLYLRIERRMTSN